MTLVDRLSVTELAKQPTRGNAEESHPGYVS
jgi:hypothetical protein